MRVGDQLVEIDGVPTDQMTHGEAIGHIKDKLRVRLVLKRVLNP
jgi:hypothetical protein